MKSVEGGSTDRERVSHRVTGEKVHWEVQLSELIGSLHPHYVKPTEY